MRRVPLLLVAALALAPAPAVAQPDDDWEVTHDPFDRKVVARYKALLARDPHDAGALSKLLSMYRRYRSVEQLEKEYAATLDGRPSDRAALCVLGRLRLAARDDAGALAYFERAAAIDADDPALQVELGALYRAAGKAAEARAAYDAALAGARSAGLKKQALRALADLALAAGDIEAARGYFDAFLALEPKNAQLRVELGDALAAAGRHDDAIAVFRDAEQAVRGDPERRVEVVLRIALALEGKGADLEAVGEYRRAIGLVPRGHYVEVEATARIVDVYRRKQDLPTLVAFYEQAWPARKRGHFEWATMGMLYEETGAADAAIDAYRKAVAKAAWELDTQRRLIQLLLSAGRQDEAVAQYEAVVKVAPGEARFQLELAELHQQRGDTPRALARLKKLAQAFAGDASVTAAIADLYLRWGQEALALAAYERLARLEPDDPSHLVVLGEQHWQKGDKASQDKALSIWRRIADAKTAAAFARLGDVLAEHGMHVDALAHYGKAIKLEPRNPELYRGRAAIHERQKQWPEAVADWESVLGLLGDQPQDRTARREARRRIVGLVTRWGSKEAEYRNRWLRAFRASPPALEAGYFLVEYYDRRPQSGEPRATLEKLRALAPTDQDVIMELVKVYRAAREFDQAIAQLEQLEQLAPHRRREIYTLISEIMTDDRRDADAILWATRAVEISGSKDPVAWQRLAERYVDMQRTTDAIAAYEKSLALDRTNHPVAFELARLYVDAGNVAAAAALYRRVLRDATEEETVQRAGRAAINLEEIAGTLGGLEGVVAPLSFQLAHKPVYRRLLVDLYLRYVPRLVAQLRHGDGAGRKAARAELDRLGSHGLKPLLEALSDDRDVNQQRAAVAVLGYLGNPGAAPRLVRLARTEPKLDDPQRRIGTLQQSLDWEVRVEALVAAGRLGSTAVMADVLPLATHDEVAMREAATFTVARTRDVRALPSLRAALDDRRESVQVLACAGLAEQADRTGAVDDALAAVVADARRHDLARAACAWALGARRARRGAPALLTALADNRGEAQRLAAWALGQLGDASALPSVLRAYLVRDDAGRDALAWTIATLAGVVVPAPLPADPTEYPMRNGKLDAAAAVARLPGSFERAGSLASAVAGHEAAIADGIRGALREHRDAVVATLAALDLRPDGLSLGALLDAAAPAPAARILDAIGAAIAGDVAALLGHRDPKVRALAASVVAKIGAAGAEDQLVAALRDEAAQVRLAATRAAPVLATRRGAPPEAVAAALLAMLRDGAWQDRRAAAEAIGALGRPRDGAALAAALADGSGYVREAAADALGRLGVPAGAELDALLAASRDDVAAVRRAAAGALARSADPRAVTRRAELAAGDPDVEVRAAASAGR